MTNELDSSISTGCTPETKIRPQDQLALRWKISTFVMMNLALFVSYGLVSLPGSFLPLYNLDRDISLFTTSIILGAVPLVYIIVCPFVAKLLDRYSSKWLLLVSTGVVSVVTMLFSALGHIEHNGLYIALSVSLRLCQGLLGGVIDVVAFAVTSTMFPDNIALAAAVLETSLNVAIAISPYIGAQLYQNVNFLLAFLVPALTIALIFLVSLVAVQDVDCRKGADEESSTKAVLTDVLIVFPAWHCAFCQTLLNFYIPVLAAYTQSEFGEGAVFAGVCLLVNTAGIILIAPFLGHLMDLFNPYIFFVVSAFALPVTYLFLGPSSFLLTLVGPSKTQILVVMGFIGFEMCMASFPSLMIMYDIYRERWGVMSRSVQNLITALYCASFPVGAFLGVVSSGIMSQYLTFSQSTTIMGLLAVVESLGLFVFCYCAWRLKRRGREVERKPLVS